MLSIDMKHDVNYFLNFFEEEKNCPIATIVNEMDQIVLRENHGNPRMRL